MADQQPHSNAHSNVVRGIDYRAAFPFIQLFRGFRLAIDPSKLALALSLLLLLYIGGRLLDAIWMERHQAVEKFEYPSAGELPMYERSPSTFRADRERALAGNEAFVKGELEARGAKNPEYDPDELVDGYEDDRDKAVQDAHTAYDASPKAKEDVVVRDDKIKAAYAVYAGKARAVEEATGEGLFIHFLNYEIAQVDSVVWSAIRLDIPGVLTSLKRFFITAPSWAITQHPLFFLLFFGWFLILWAIFGGALSRVAAVQVARDEKISVRQALRFSTGKVLSYVFAPLIPIIIIAAIGLVLALVASLMSLPWGLGGLWSIVVGGLFFIALIAGLIMMLTAIGLIGGGHLMYPTISVEGSDSFDAVSRSFSYLYARPWQLAFYTLVALVYGAITYLFVRVALYVLLKLVHASISLLQWGTAADGSPIVDAMWPQPDSFMSLSYETNFAALGPLQSVGAFLMAFWIYLAIATLGAYAISLYFSSSTVIYYLLRKDVDATELDEVYIEPNDEEFVETPPAPTESTSSSTTAGGTGATGSVAGATAASSTAASTTESSSTPSLTNVDPVPPSEPAGQPVDLPTPPPENPTDPNRGNPT